MMTPDQEKHLEDIKSRIDVKLDAKYKKGQIEHGGNLWDRNPVKDISDEVTDLVTYAHCLEARDIHLEIILFTALALINQGKLTQAKQCIKKAIKKLK